MPVPLPPLATTQHMHASRATQRVQACCCMTPSPCRLITHHMPFARTVASFMRISISIGCESLNVPDHMKLLAPLLMSLPDVHVVLGLAQGVDSL